jgi:carbonic anhydrase/acetyltransferase-like protein (isoleucine patch superfamily)
VIKSFNNRTPKVAESAFISEAAYVMGDVEIGENSSVWPGAVLRGDFAKIEIGRSTAVEDNCIIHAGMGDIMIGDEVHIGHGAVIDCQEIGNRVLIGMNSTILHGAEIGDFCVIAAGCLVSQGMKIPSNSFVAGVPGKIKGEVSAKQLWWAQGGSEIYAKLAEQYKEQGL